MASDVARFFRVITIFVLLAGVVKTSVVKNLMKNGFVNPVSEPCYGAGNGRVRALTIDSLLAPCGEFVQCLNDQTEELRNCPADRPFFDAETQECVTRDNVCFKCPTRTPYEFISVPHICEQFILCFNNKPLLLYCPDGLVFDGSPGVHQCNVPPALHQCHREDPNDFESRNCLTGVSLPYYETFDDKKGVYYVCHGGLKPVRLQCEPNLVFIKELGVCDKL